MFPGPRPTAALQAGHGGNSTLDTPSLRWRKGGSLCLHETRNARHCTDNRAHVGIQIRSYDRGTMTGPCTARRCRHSTPHWPVCTLTRGAATLCENKKKLTWDGETRDNKSSNSQSKLCNGWRQKLNSKVIKILRHIVRIEWTTRPEMMELETVRLLTLNFRNVIDWGESSIQSSLIIPAILCEKKKKNWTWNDGASDNKSSNTECKLRNRLRQKVNSLSSIGWLYGFKDIQ